MAPVIVSTWSFSQAGNSLAWPILTDGGDPMDAVLEACRAAEDDPAVDSVGFGGLPDASGAVTLDGCVMRSPAQCGSACGLRRHAHPAQVARLVMERTRHIMLAGEAADAFAHEQGQPERDLLAPAARAAWKAWRATPTDDAAGQQTRDASLVRPIDSGDPSTGALFARGEQRWHGHDTIGTLAIGRDGRMAGACSTSGTPYKTPGRVGDSPIIGHGLYVDPAHGGATATGSGELIMGVCGAFLAVECMRRGATPEQAARAVVERVSESFQILPHHQTAFLVIAPDGRWSSASLRAGFLAAVHDENGARLVPAAFTLRDD
ncbi:MAG: isoaspartyl peptidase/L-asparaginase [Phycisphaerae bacterium]|nr:isoaspartyl peptidase/L-asparaginase [Phycisphaerae bacterium]